MQRSRGSPANLDLIEEIDSMMHGLQVTFEYVAGHTGDPGNEEADR